MSQNKKYLKFFKNLTLVIFFLGFVFVYHTTFAQSEIPCASGQVPTSANPCVTGSVPNACDPNKQLCNPIRFNSIPEFFEELLKIAAQIGSVVIILGLVYSGFLFISARGNQEELSKAKKAFTYTVIGAMIVLGAWAFSVAIGNTIRTITNPPAGP
jgi:hypothetical protein